MEHTTRSGPGPFTCIHGRFDSQLAAGTTPSTLERLEASKQVLPTLPPPPPYTNSQRWRAAEPMGAYSATQRACQHSHGEYDRLARREFVPQPYTPLSRPPSPEADDVPFGHFVSPQAFWEEDDEDDNTSCADEAPPSYAVAIGQSDGGRLLQHFLRGYGGYGEVDEESGVELDMAWEIQRREDEGCAVLKIVGMFAVAIILFGVSGVLGWMVLDGILQ